MTGKKFLTMLMATFMTLALAFSLAGCGQQKTPEEFSEPTESHEDYEDDYAERLDEDADSPDLATEDTEATEATKNTEAIASTEPETTEAATEEPEEDPLATLLVSEADARELGGVFLKRGDKLYALELQKIGKIQPGDKGVGAYQKNRINLYEHSAFHLYDNRDEISFGDIEIPTFEPGDEIVGYGATSTPLVNPRLYEFCGYTVPVTPGASRYCIQTIGGGYSDAIEVKYPEDSQFTISDSDGNVVPRENWDKLNRNEIYTISWYTGTTYNEIERAACCRYYRPITDVFGLGVIDPVMTKDGYAIYPLPDLEPGCYQLSSFGFINIK